MNLLIVRGRGVALTAAVVWGCASAAVVWLVAGGLGGETTYPDSTGAVHASMPAPRRSVQSVATPPGWLATYRDQGNKASVNVHVSNAAFAAGVGQSVHPAIAPASFTVIYSGTLTIPEPGRYRFGAEVEGGDVEVGIFGSALRRPVALSITRDTFDGRMSRWIELGAGEIKLRYEFKRRNENRARMRALWEKSGVGLDGFRAEPIPAGRVSIDAASAKTASDALSVQRGRVLLNKFGCVNCHTGRESLSASVPPLEGPLLGGAHNRMDPDWMLKWIMSPQEVKPGTSMPDLIGSAASDVTDAESIVHFLMSLGTSPKQTAIATEPAVIERGSAVYHSVGCVACHGPMDGSPAVEIASPFGHMDSKWEAAALSAFLQNPVAVRPDGRMPSMDLSEEEADAVSTFLVSDWGGASGRTFDVDSTKVARGRRAFTALGCVACHQLGEGFEELATGEGARPFEQLRPPRGCLKEDDAKSPDYKLIAQQRTDLIAAIDAVGDWQGADAPVDMASMKLDMLNCTACHERGLAGGVPSALRSYFTAEETVDPGDEGRIPPHLNGVGGKLSTHWFDAVLTKARRARPYMHTRMPQFGQENVGELAQQMAMLDGVWPDSDRDAPASTDEAVRAGRALAGAQAYNCISCHAFADRALAGSAGPNLVNFSERLRYDWWNRYIHNPARFKPGTRMSGFFLSREGTAQNKDILQGDPQSQSDALWAYLNLGELFMPPPDGVPSAGGIELRVGDRPRILRTFLENASSRGIAVGFPSGVHFAFDAQTCRLTDVWRGQFLDASGAWAGRGGSITGGKGPGVWTAPSGPAVVVSSDDSNQPPKDGTPGGQTTRFRGYRLDSAGVPTFHYEISPTEGASGWTLDVQERFEPSPVAGSLIRRTFTVSGGVGAVWIDAGSGTVTIAALAGGQSLAELVLDGSNWLTFKAEDAQEMRIVLEVSP
jgi:mono/diheme cytochrome c family protein